MIYIHSRKITMKTLHLLLVSVLIGSLSAQTITNVNARQYGIEVIITYDMAGSMNPDEEVLVGYSTDGESSYTIITDAEGDVGKNVQPGEGKQINWFVLDEKIGGKSARFKVRISPEGMVWVEGGTFQMGSNVGNSDERPVHSVTVNGFFMDMTEVTQVEYRQIVGRSQSNFRDCDNCPVETVDWHDALIFAEMVGKRLPTEAEWEYAARGGSHSGFRYSGGDKAENVAWYRRNTGKPHPVALKQPNELGLYDMSGNVWEWCADWYDKDYYSRSPQNNPKGPIDGSYRVLRGGSWYDSAFYSRITTRYYFSPRKYKYNHVGFRCVQDF